MSSTPHALPTSTSPQGPGLPAGAGESGPPTRQPPRCPYVGPRAFRYGERLYGRDTELLSLMDLLIARRQVLLHSPSGAGKSSLIQAALRPALE